MTDLKMAPFMMIQFYKYLTDKFGEQGRNTFHVGFKLYCFRKGICCAQRVVSKNLPLTYNNYRLNKEGVFVTKDGREQVKAMRDLKPGTTEWIKDGYISRTYACTTRDAFEEFNAPPELRHLWCTYVDKVMAQTYNPDIFYEVVASCQTKDYCEHHVLERGMTKENSSGSRTEDAPPLSFLTWRAWSSMVEMIESILGEPGMEVVAKVKADTIKQYGDDAWKEIQQFEGTKLDVLYRGQA